MKPDADDDLNFSSFSQLVLRHKWVVGILTLMCGVITGVIAVRTKPYFSADVTVTEVREHGNGSLGALASSLGGLASIAGVNLGAAGGGGSTVSQESAAVLESHRVAAEFIRRNNLLPVLLAKSSKPPTMWLAVKELTQNVLTIRKDPRKGTTTVTMQWTDPVVAAQWANSYVALANELIRARALDESTRNITYLNTQLAKIDSVDLRKVMYTLIENETKTLMIANGRPEYAYEVVDPAVAPEIKLGPHRLLNTLLGLALGFALGAMVAFGIEHVRTIREGVRKATAPG